MATQQSKTATDLGDQAIALAEQLGRIAGTIEGTAESWMNRRKLAEQLTRVRDSATRMLAGLNGTPAAGRKGSKANKPKSASAAPTRQGADPSRAPGKKRRKPAPTLHGVKKSDETIPKARLAEANRQRRKTNA
jgi:hypothetical protein